MAASYDVSVTVESEYWGNLLVDMPYTPGYAPVTSGPADNWDPGDPGDWDLKNAKVTFLDVNIGKTYPINKLAPRVFKYLDNWFNDNIEKWQPEVEGSYDDYDDYYDDGY